MIERLSLGKLDLTNIDNWKLINAQQVAAMFGFEYNPDFENAFLDFVQNTLPTATVTNFLAPVFLNHLNNYPDLERKSATTHQPGNH